MAIPVYIELYDNDKRKIEGDVKIKGREGTVEAYAFGHGVSIPTDPQTGQVTATRKHAALTFLTGMSPATPYLHKACCKGQTLSKVLARFYRINDQGSEQEHFEIELNNAKVTSVDTVTKNVKNPANERYPHLLLVSVRYEQIVWRHKDGNVEYADSWNSGKQ
jgi:type VI secretion system secreted protein Hcp